MKTFRTYRRVPNQNDKVVFGENLSSLLPTYNDLSKLHKFSGVIRVGDKIDVICEGGIQRGTHVLKALASGAKACSGGRLYLYALAGAGQLGVERALGNLRTEIERDMKLMGCKSISELNRSHLRFRRK